METNEKEKVVPFPDAEPEANAKEESGEFLSKPYQKRELPQSGEEEESLVVKFKRPYRFDGKLYTEIDLSGLEDLSAADMCAAEKFLNRNGMISPLPEMTAEYICYIAGVVAEQPVEFFKGLPPKNFIQVKNKITSFFYGED